MKRLQIITLVLLTLGVLAQPAFARSGCCSWHDGVRSDGCGCNDGTALSSTCAPYYQCTSSSSYGSTSYTAPSFEKTYNGTTYYSESSYNAAVTEAEFEQSHKESIKNNFQSILEREPSGEEVETWFNFSRDIYDIEQALLGTDEYKELQFKNEHEQNVRTAYIEITGEEPTETAVQSLANSSRDIQVIRGTIQNEYQPQQTESGNTDSQTTTTSKKTTSTNNNGIVSFLADVMAFLVVIALMIFGVSFLALPFILIFLLIRWLQKRKNK
ncbi:MAG: hypothetical protein WCV88_05735 [Patescibacteria group bacterium]|jgi:hypothetical protein